MYSTGDGGVEYSVEATVDGPGGSSGGAWSGDYVGVDCLDWSACDDESCGSSAGKAMGYATYSLDGEAESDVSVVPSEVPLDV